jgi:hypothetical protein
MEILGRMQTLLLPHITVRGFEQSGIVTTPSAARKSAMLIRRSRAVIVCHLRTPA